MASGVWRLAPLAGVGGAHLRSRVQAIGDAGTVAAGASDVLDWRFVALTA